MIIKEFWFQNRRNRFKVREWNCCGYKWQLLLSKRFPERYIWKPVCPNCGKKGIIPGDMNVDNVIN